MRLAWLAGAVVLASVACAGVRDRIGAIGSQSERSAIYYVAVDRLPVHAEASASSRVVGELALHEKVSRSALARGWARVATADRRVAGWVDNARLEWRSGAAVPTPAAADGATPSAPAPAANPPPAEAQAPEPPPATPPAEAQAPEPPPAEPPADPAAPSAPRRPRPATFDPF